MPKFLVVCALRPENCNDTYFVSIGGTESCRHGNFRCPQWRKVGIMCSIYVYVSK